MKTRAHINGTDIHYEVQGDGPPLVLVHGSWVDSIDWEAVTGTLAEVFRVITYDRRGHTRSDQGRGEDTRRTDEDDLAEIIESIGGGPAHLIGNSFGGLISLGVAARRPELVRSVSVHEPPAVSVLGDEMAAVLMGVVSEIAEEIDTGDREAATRRFMEEIALGPGSWNLLTERERTTFVANAPTFVGETRDPVAYEVDRDPLVAAGLPTQVTKGTDSPPHLLLLADELASALPHAETGSVEGAGHAPHETHPLEYVDLVTEFATRHDRVAA